MTPEKQRIAIAKACGWRKWQFGDPFLEGLRLADQKFGGYVRRVTRVYDDGVTLDVDESPLYSFATIQREYLPVNFWLSPEGKWWKDLPDYLGNLNAMHDAENVLLLAKGTNRLRWEEYDNHLFNLCGGFARAHATAPQRAEALLRTLGLWEEDAA